MKTRIASRAVRTGLLGALAAMSATQARATDAADEIRLLKARLSHLEAKIARQEHAKKPVQARTSETAKQAAPAPLLAEGRPAPDRFYFKGLQIIPGGFLAFESIYRSRWMGADNNTPFQNIPYGFIPGGHTDEYRMTARPSRPNLMIKADIDPQTHVMAFGEVDFLGAAQTANSNQSNSYNLRMRQLYADIDSDTYGVHAAAGQMWSLATMNSVGTRPDTSLQPPTIDHQYMPGYVWARQPGIRLIKDFGKKLWLAFAAESSAVTYALPGPAAFGTTNLPLINAPLLLAPPAAGGLFNAANNYSFNRMPDFIGKAAWDGNIADRAIHVEAFGLLRDMTDRAYWGNHSQWAGGVGAGVIVPIFPKLLDFQLSGMTGRGIGRYSAGQINDASYQLSGAVQPLHERIAMAGLTLHATPRTDIFAFAGGEFASKQPQWSIVGGALLVGGYGNPFYNNSGCGFENDAVAAGVALNVPLLPCSGQTKALRQLTGGIWHTFYEGDFGKLRVGAQYSYTVRDAFVGFGATPKGTENMVYTSLRYYPFEGPTSVLAPRITK